MGQFVVKRHRPWQWALSIVALSMIIATLTWLMLDKSHWSFIQSQLRENQEVKKLWQMNEALKKENTALRDKMLMLERTTSLDKQTAALLQNDIKNMQEDIYDLTRELEFYQGIMEAAGEVKGLSVHGIHVVSLKNNAYRLKLILTNVARTDRVVEGNMEIYLDGVQNGASKRLDLKEVIAEKSVDLAFKFRNFKRFDTTIRLPDKFLPRQVVVWLLPKDKNKANIKKVFEWPVSVG